jgi:SAM-dependent methyltransferase
MQFLLDIILALVVITVMLLLVTAVVNLFIRVPYVPSKKRDISYILDLAKLKDGEKVYDLGCGDGRFLFEAEKRANITAVGYEAAPIPFLLSQFFKLIKRARTKIFMKNFFKTDLKDANVIFCYLGPDIMKKLGEKISAECKKGTRIFSNSFHIENMEPVAVYKKDTERKHSTIYFYQV